MSICPVDVWMSERYADIWMGIRIGDEPLFPQIGVRMSKENVNTYAV